MTSFAGDIAPLFRDRDVASMSFMFDLHSYEDVKTHADAILESVSEGRMPCDAAWEDDQIAKLQAWIDEGYPA